MAKRLEVEGRERFGIQLDWEFAWIADTSRWGVHLDCGYTQMGSSSGLRIHLDGEFIWIANIPRWGVHLDCGYTWMGSSSGLRIHLNCEKMQNG